MTVCVGVQVTNARRSHVFGQTTQQVRQMKSELQTLRGALKNKDEECSLLAANYKRREDSHQVRLLAAYLSLPVPLPSLSLSLTLT